MNKLILSTAILALTAGAALAESHGSVVRIGTEGAYPPYNFLNDAGEVDGFERALGDELCARAELTCEWVTNDWDSIIPNLVSSNYDAIMAGMSVTDERKEVIAFSEQYTLPDPSSFLVMDEAADLATGVIAAQSGTIQAAYVATSGATLLEFATPDESVAAVKNGEADAVLADKSFLAPLAEADGELSLVAQDVMIGGGIGIGLRQSDEELKAKFDAAIISMKEDGSLNALIAKWLPDAGQFE
jgi:polar amino acid transport system substrate-binding protein